VRCSECAAELPPLRDECPKCGAPTAWGLRRQGSGAPGGRSPEELKRNRKTVLVACAAIAGMLAVGGRLSWPVHSVHISLHEPRRGPVVTNADTLYRAYRDDPDSAAKRFRGREITVNGEFLRIVPDGYGSIDMRLKTSNPDQPLGVDLVNESVDDSKLLRPGQQVTVSCRRVSHTGDEHWLQDCAIQPGDAGSAPTPSAASAPSITPPAPPPPTRPGLR
jgi:hypothetical protein